jgi:hypothetical protein
VNLLKAYPNGGVPSLFFSLRLRKLFVSLPGGG